MYSVINWPTKKSVRELAEQNLRFWEYRVTFKAISEVINTNYNKKVGLLGLACGMEPLPLWLSQLRKVDHILVTDLYSENDLAFLNKIQFIKYGELNVRGKLPHISARHMDLRELKSEKEIGNFDIAWSVSALEHVGQTGLRPNFKQIQKLLFNLHDRIKFLVLTVPVDITSDRWGNQEKWLEMFEKASWKVKKLTDKPKIDNLYESDDSSSGTHSAVLIIAESV